MSAALSSTTTTTTTTTSNATTTASVGRNLFPILGTLTQLHIGDDDNDDDDDVNAFTGANKNHVVLIVHHTTTILGRGSVASEQFLPISLDAHVSRKQALLVRRDSSTWTLRNIAKSRTIVYVNEFAITIDSPHEEILFPGSRIRFGDNVTWIWNPTPLVSATTTTPATTTAPTTAALATKKRKAAMLGMQRHSSRNGDMGREGDMSREDNMGHHLQLSERKKHQAIASSIPHFPTEMTDLVASYVPSQCIPFATKTRLMMASQSLGFRQLCSHTIPPHEMVSAITGVPDSTLFVTAQAGGGRITLWQWTDEGECDAKWSERIENGHWPIDKTSKGLCAPSQIAVLPTHTYLSFFEMENKKRGKEDKKDQGDKEDPNNNNNNNNNNHVEESSFTIIAVACNYIGVQLYMAAIDTTTRTIYYPKDAVLSALQSHTCGGAQVTTVPGFLVCDEYTSNGYQIVCFSETDLERVHYKITFASAHYPNKFCHMTTTTTTSHTSDNTILGVMTNQGVLHLHNLDRRHALATIHCETALLRSVYAPSNPFLTNGQGMTVKAIWAITAATTTTTTTTTHTFSHNPHSLCVLVLTSAHLLRWDGSPLETFRIVLTLRRSNQYDACLMDDSTLAIFYTKPLECDMYDVNTGQITTTIVDNDSRSFELSTITACSSQPW